MRIDMRSFLVILLLAVGGWCRASLAMEASVSSPYADALRSNGWETALVTLRDVPTSGMLVVTLADARGGLAFARSIDASAATALPNLAGRRELQLLFPIPCVDEAAIPHAEWPLVVTVSGPGMPANTFPVTLPRPMQTESATLRILEIREPQAAARTFPARPGTTEIRSSLSPAAFARTPALALSGFDILLLSAADAAAIDRPRALALINAGVQLIIESNRPPDAALGSFVWTRVKNDTGDATNFWCTPAQPLPRATVLEPGLAATNVRDFLPQPTATPGLFRSILLTAPVAIALLLLLRVLIRKQSLLLGAVTTTMIVWAAVAAALVAGTASGNLRSARWQTVRVGQTGADAALFETFKASSALVARDLHYALQADQLILPVAVYPRQYFSVRGTLHVDGPSPALDLHAPARSLVVLLSRFVEPTRTIPPLPAAATELPRWSSLSQIPLDGAWVEGGYVQTDLATPPNARLPLDRWLRQSFAKESTVAPALLWYELRFHGGNLYHLRSTTTSEGSPLLHILNFGPAPLPAASRPAETAPDTRSGT